MRARPPAERRLGRIARLRLAWIAVALLVLLASSEAAADEPAGGPAVEIGNPPAGVSGAGSPHGEAVATDDGLPHADVRAGDVTLAAFTGYGFGFVRAPAYRGGETDDVEAVPLFPQIGYRLSDRLGGDAWYAGSFELLLEGTLLWETAPRSGFAGGAGLLLRYDVLSVRQVVPFLELGGGMLDLDFDLEDQSDGFNFTLHGGVGLRYVLDPSWSVALAYRWQHISNAGTGSRNDGIDMHQPLVGLSYRFGR